MFTAQLFTQEPGDTFDASLDTLLYNFSSTVAHELGHGLGMPHVSHLVSATGTDEVQEIRIDSGVANFTLSLGGASATFARNASPLTIQNGLRGLPGMANSALIVSGPVGGPYRLDYVNPAHSPNAGQRQVDFPLIQGVGMTSRPVAEGSYHPVFGREIVIGSNRGRNDLMHSEGIFPRLTFLPLISQPILAMSLGTSWAQSEARLAMTVYTRASGARDLKVPAPAAGEQPVAEPDEDFFVDGPALVLIDTEGLLASDEIDFGTVPADGAGNQQATRRLTLRNFGSDDVVVRSIRITQGFDQFSVLPIPVTTLRPSETLDVDVTFDPRFSGPAAGVLSIESDAEDFSGSLDLQGIGQLATPAPGIHVDFGLNNFDGVPVGETRSLQDINVRRLIGSLPTVRNVGDQPLTVTDIRTAAGPGQDEYSVADPLPVVLQPGREVHVQSSLSSQRARPAAGCVRDCLRRSADADLPPAGCRHGPRGGQSGLRQRLRGRGVGVPVFDNTPVLRTRSDAGGNWEFFLRPETLVHIATFDPVSGLIAHGYARTNLSGQRTEFNIGAFAPSTYHDTDGDGLPDDVEFAVGTSVDSIDSDGDGLSDFAELSQGLNPLDGPAHDHGRRRRPGAGRLRSGHCPDSRYGNRWPSNRLPGCSVPRDWPSWTSRDSISRLCWASSPCRATAWTWRSNLQTGSRRSLAREDCTSSTFPTLPIRGCAERFPSAPATLCFRRLRVCRSCRARERSRCTTPRPASGSRRCRSMGRSMDCGGMALCCSPRPSIR